MHLLVWLFIIGLTTGAPLEVAEIKDVQSAEVTQSRIFEQILLDVLEVVRDLMVNGSDAVPVLDPLAIERIHIDGNAVGLTESYVTLNNLTANGISKFDFDELSVTLTSLLLQRYRADFNLYIPSINVNTDNYDILIKIFGGEIFGQGDMSLRVVNPRIKGSITVGVQINLRGVFVTIHNCRIRFGLDEFNPAFTGMFGNEVSSEFVSAFLRTLIPELLEYFENEIADILSTAVLTIGNSILEDLNLLDLIGNSQNMELFRNNVNEYSSIDV